MKSLMQIAEECDMRYNLKVSLSTKNSSCKKRRQKGVFDKYQEDYMHFILYFSLKINEITLNSK
jgi:hypothetical protein